MSPVIVDRPDEAETVDTTWSFATRALLIVTSFAGPAIFLSVSAIHGRNAWLGPARVADWLTAGNVSYSFVPLWMYSAAALVAAVCSPDGASRRFLVRFGVYSGMALALHTVIAWISCLGGGITVTSVVVSAGVAAMLFLGRVVWPERKWIWRAMPWWFWMLAAAALIAITSDEAVIYWLLLLPFVSIPFLSLSAYWIVSAAIYQHHGGRGQFGVGQSLWLLTWASAYFAAWQAAIRNRM